MNMLNLQFLATKDQAIDVWHLVHAHWENQSGQCVKVFRSDNGGEFLNTAFTVELETAGIIQQLSAPYAHQQNGKAERVIHTIEGRMYAMLDHTRLPQSFWGEAALCATYLFNHTESCSLPPGKTPYEMLHGTKPGISHLWVFSAWCFVCIPAELQEKLGPCSHKAVFMGYPPGVKAWRCHDSVSSAFFNSCDIIFNESFSNRPFPMSDSDDKNDDDASPHQLVAPQLVTPPPSAPASSTSSAAPPVSMPNAMVHHSGWSQLPTKKSHLFHKKIAADALRLERQCDI
jgi:hypothetical protein